MSDKEKEEEEEVIEFTKGEMEMLKVRTRISTFRKFLTRIMTNAPPYYRTKKRNVKRRFFPVPCVEFPV